LIKIRINKGGAENTTMMIS